MKPTKRFALILCLLAVAGAARVPSAAQGRPSGRAITFDDLMRLERISEAQVSPNGKWVAYKVGTPDREANRTATNIWVVSTAGGAPLELTRSGRDSRPQWSPDSKSLAFLSSRGGTRQVHIISVEGGEATQLTHISGDADNVLWSPDGKTIAFTSDVYPDCRDDACNSKRDAEREKSKVKARIYDRLLYRHWKSWSEGKRSHLFVIAVEGGPSAAVGPGTPRDLTPGADYDVPPFSLGGPDDVAFSPDGKELCFTADTDKDEALSTNGDLFIVPVDGGAPPKRITTNPGFDGGPAYSPDGHFIAYRAQMKAGYESDRWRLMLYDRQSGRHINLTEDLDSSPEGYAWSADSKAIFFHFEDRAEAPIYSISASGGKAKAIVKDGFNGDLSASGDGRLLVFTRSSLTAPSEIFAANADGTDVHALTRHNAQRMAALDLNKPESFWFEGAEGAKLHGLLVRPPSFDASRKYPLLLLVHGGPQGAWDDTWGYRWNAQMFAAAGYVAVMINPRGSTGYGQKFTDDINADWGGKVFVDLMKGVDYVLAKYPFVDGTRMGAAGGSYGGYMMNWFASHAQGRFKCLISHAGPYNNDSMYGATEELWFPEWDLRGTPWNNAGTYDKWSPHKYAGEFGKYRTPTLVINGELDFRVPYTEGLQMFTALRRQGVPAKLVIFPDEGHWIEKPQNSELWYKTFLDWLAAYLK
ncbi:MAG TPA: S9 family peptidase [Candidatus Acidoferrales bacterium]|nr:S9 family peptidase [Candidatus Acidoferrales bacterium]